MSHPTHKTLLPLLLVCLLASGLLAKPPIRMELVTESGFPITGSQRWLKLLSGIGVEGLRIRPSRPGDETSVTNVGTKDRPSYKIVGLLTVQHNYKKKLFLHMSSMNFIWSFIK